MKKIQMYLTENELEKLRKEAINIGISLSELIRRILDVYIDKEKGK